MRSKDEKDIRSVLTTYVEAWRKHGIDAWGSLFTGDADFVGNEGEWAKSNRENVALHRAIPASVVGQVANYGLPTAKIEFLGPDTALVYALWEWPGFVRRPGEEPTDRKGINTMVMIRQGGQWLIRTSQNTRVSLEIPSIPGGQRQPMDKRRRPQPGILANVVPRSPAG